MNGLPNRFAPRQSAALEPSDALVESDSPPVPTISTPKRAPKPTASHGLLNQTQAEPALPKK